MHCQETLGTSREAVFAGDSQEAFQISFWEIDHHLKMIIDMGICGCCQAQLPFFGLKNEFVVHYLTLKLFHVLLTGSGFQIANDF